MTVECYRDLEGAAMAIYWDYIGDRVSFGVILGLYRGFIGIMEKKMETTKGIWGLNWRYIIGIMEKKMETLGPIKGIL